MRWNNLLCKNVTSTWKIFGLRHTVGHGLLQLIWFFVHKIYTCHASLDMQSDFISRVWLLSTTGMQLFKKLSLWQRLSVTVVLCLQICKPAIITITVFVSFRGSNQHNWRGLQLARDDLRYYAEQPSLLSSVCMKGLLCMQFTPVVWPAFLHQHYCPAIAERKWYAVE